MRASYMRENLSAALTLATRNVSKRPTLAVLGCVMLRVEDAGTTITATDLNTTTHTWAPCKSDEDGGPVVVNARELLSAVKGCAKGSRVDLDSTGGSLIIRNLGSETSLPVQPVEDWPNNIKLPTGHPVRITSRNLRAALAAVIPCASTDYTRPALRAIKIETHGDGLRFVATDNYRVGTITVPTLDPSAISVVLDLDSAILLRDALSGMDDPVSIVIGEYQASFEWDDNPTTIIGRVIDGTFPNWEQVMPADHPTAITVDRAALIAAVKAAGQVAKLSDNVIRFDVNYGEIVVSAKSGYPDDTRTYSRTLETAQVGPPTHVSLRWSQILDALQAFDADGAVFAVRGPLEPIAIYAAPSRESAQTVIMPVRTE